MADELNDEENVDVNAEKSVDNLNSEESVDNLNSEESVDVNECSEVSDDELSRITGGVRSRGVTYRRICVTDDQLQKGEVKVEIPLGGKSE